MLYLVMVIDFPDVIFIRPVNIGVGLYRVVSDKALEWAHWNTGWNLRGRCDYMIPHNKVNRMLEDGLVIAGRSSRQ